MADREPRGSRPPNAARRARGDPHPTPHRDLTVILATREARIASTSGPESTRRATSETDSREHESALIAPPHACAHACIHTHARRARGEDKYDIRARHEAVARKKEAGRRARQPNRQRTQRTARSLGARAAWAARVREERACDVRGTRHRRVVACRRVSSSLRRSVRVRAATRAVLVERARGREGERAREPCLFEVRHELSQLLGRARARRAGRLEPGDDGR